MRRGKRLTKAQLEEKIADLENKWKRALADYINLEKRFEKEKEAFVKFSNAQLLDKILPILDDLELCERHAKDKGISLVYERFREVLKSEGLEEIKVLREEFNPKTMDAIEIGPGPKNKVIGAILKGYLLNGEVLRPAKVKVGGGKIAKKKLGKTRNRKIKR